MGSVNSNKSTSQNLDNNDVMSEKSHTDFGIAALKIDDLRAASSDEHLDRGDTNVTSQKVKDDVINENTIVVKSSVKSVSSDLSELGDVSNNDDVTIGGYSDDDFEA